MKTTPAETLLVGLLKKYKVCSLAIQWAERRPAGESLKKSWDACEEGNWLLWVAVTVGVDRRKVVFAACKCARLSLRYVPKGDARPLAALRAAEAWCRGKATIEQVRSAANAAYAATYADAATYAYAAIAATYAAYAYAAYDADAAYAATYAAAAYAADAAYAAAAAYAADAAYDARSKTLARCARIVREHISWRAVHARIKNTPGIRVKAVRG